MLPPILVGSITYKITKCCCGCNLV